MLFSADQNGWHEVIFTLEMIINNFGHLISQNIIEDSCQDKSRTMPQNDSLTKKDADKLHLNYCICKLNY